MKELKEMNKSGRWTSIMQALHDYNKIIAIALSYGIPESEIKKITSQTDDVKILDEAREKVRDLIKIKISTFKIII